MGTIDKIILNGTSYDIGVGSGSGLTEDIKAALLQLAAKVTYIDDGGQDYYEDLEDALYPPVPPAVLSYITCVYTQSGTVYDTDTLNSLKSDLVVTAHYDNGTTGTVAYYTLSGTLTAGTSTITVSYGGKTTTFNVAVTHQAVIDYTLDAIDDVTWTDGKTYNTSTGALETSSNYHCTDKFSVQGQCFYNILPNVAGTNSTIYEWDESETFVGCLRASANLPKLTLCENHLYALSIYSESGSITGATMLPVDNRLTAVGNTIEINLVADIDSITWISTQNRNTGELDITSLLSQYGISSSNYLTKINGIDSKRLALGINIQGFSLISGFENDVVFSIGTWQSNMLLQMKSTTYNTLDLLKEYITSNSVKVIINP